MSLPLPAVMPVYMPQFVMRKDIVEILYHWRIRQMPRAPTVSWHLTNAVPRPEGEFPLWCPAL